MAEVVRAAYPDPKYPEGKLVVVDLEAARPLAAPGDARRDQGARRVRREPAGAPGAAVGRAPDRGAVEGDRGAGRAVSERASSRSRPWERPRTPSGIARALVERRLAACVNVRARASSRIYRWKGEVESDEERLLVIKTRAERFEALREALVDAAPLRGARGGRARRSSGGHAPYLAWLDESVALGRAARRAATRRQGVLEVGDEVVGVLAAHADPHQAVADPEARRARPACSRRGSWWRGARSASRRRRGSRRASTAARAPSSASAASRLPRSNEIERAEARRLALVDLVARVVGEAGPVDPLAPSAGRAGTRDHGARSPRGAACAGPGSSCRAARARSRTARGSRPPRSARTAATRACASSCTTATPPTLSEWPFRNFVVECTTMSAPRASGRWKNGLMNVLSTTRIAPRARARPRRGPRCRRPSSAGWSGVSIQSMSKSPGLRVEGRRRRSRRGTRTRRRSCARIFVKSRWVPP